jgi:hypothetical protein
MDSTGAGKGVEPGVMEKTQSSARYRILREDARVYRQKSCAR